MKHIVENFRLVKFMLLAIFVLALCGCKDDDIEAVPNGGASVNKTVEEINSNLRALQKLLVAQDADKAVKPVLKFPIPLIKWNWKMATVSMC